MKNNIAVSAFVGCIAFLFIYIILIVYSAFTIGFVISTLWGWFICSIFPSVPPISIAHGIGLSIFFNSLDLKYKEKVDVIFNKDNDKNKALAYTASIIFTPWISLLFGWIIYHFVM